MVTLKGTRTFFDRQPTSMSRLAGTIFARLPHQITQRRPSRHSLSGISLGFLSDGYPLQTAGMTEGEMDPDCRLAMYAANKTLNYKLFNLEVTVTNDSDRRNFWK